MLVDLNEEIVAHLQRVRELADEAKNDDEESFSSRASAMTAFSNLLRDLTKTQKEIVNMGRIQRLEQALVETVKEIFTEDQYELFCKKFEELMRAWDTDHNSN